MAPYESDSDDGEDASYTETNVLLGYASEEPSDDTISYLGGVPTWLDSQSLPSAALAKCKVCNDLMVLLLQLNADLPEYFPGHERRLYIFTCRRKTCKRKEGSVRVLRESRAEKIGKNRKENVETMKEKIVEEKKEQVNIGDTLFGTGKNPISTGAGGGNANPFSTVSSNNSTTNPFAPKAMESKPSSPTEDLPKTFASALNITPPPPQTFGPPPPSEPWPNSSSFPPAYPQLYLVDADYEILDRAPLPDIPINTGTMDVDEGSGSGGGKEDKEVFESTLDIAFQKFADRIGMNPEQVLRYEFRGSPLLYSATDTAGQLLSISKGNEKVKTASENSSGIPRCGNCGKGRVFECQLTPHAIMELEREEERIDGMEWGTVVVGVCENDCRPNYVRDGEVGWVEEWCGVQWEEIGGR
ncbi:programmed cell death protein 2 [Amylocarpus encephaloides]|uniref:Programmed cell death protein 2 n=1 Tax=Amylocarpus encephaloides TaxID=45428 RepID=A0A9P7YLE7_9HELO|nr:programmed cell death protein 2 [Amylocarpus encephaloides]